MYHPPIAPVSNSQKIFEMGNRFLEFFTLSLRSALHKKKDENKAFSYFLNSIKKGSTVLDIGTHNYDYLYQMLKMAKRSGKLIAVESEPDIYNYLFEKKEILKCKNIMIERLQFAEVTGKTTSGISLSKRNGATVIDLKTRINQGFKEVAAAQTLDNYCAINNIIPDLLKINGEGKELAILYGSVEILSKYRPKILIECEQRHAGRDTILKTFKLLTDLKYSGYFILDDMKLPLANFDFNIYQNPLSNFYCKDFIFE